jgi:RHS repeat-associated protein
MTDNIGKTIYGYDSIYQLTSVQYPDKPSVSYAYDPVGNRQTMTVGTNSPVNYTYNNANMLQTAGITTFTYDGNGNMVQQTTGGQNTNYVYDTQNHLTQVTLPSGTKSLFGYDYTGMRISDTEPGPNGNPETKSSLWNGMDVVNEDSPYKRESYNVLNGINLSKSILGKNSPNPRVNYFEFDGLGSVADTTDSTENIMDKFRYDPYGQTLSGGQNNDNDLQFAGSMGVRDQGKSELIYMRNRWYNPELGVFLSKDPIGFRGGINLYDYAESVGKPSMNLYEYAESVGKPSLNLYEYANNNPLRFTDPLGLFETQISIDITSFGINGNFPLAVYNNGSLSLAPNFGSYTLSGTDALVGGDFQFHYNTDTQLLPPGWSAAFGLNKFLSIGADSTGGIVNLGLGVGLPVAVSRDFLSVPQSRGCQ